MTFMSLERAICGHFFLLNFNSKHDYMWDLLYIGNMMDVQFVNSKEVLE